jgi:hypothetical protein
MLLKSRSHLSRVEVLTRTTVIIFFAFAEKLYQQRHIPFFSVNHVFYDKQINFFINGAAQSPYVLCQGRMV